MKNSVKGEVAKLGNGGFKEGSNLQKGRAYHDIPIPGYEDIPVHRGGNAARVDLILENLMTPQVESHSLLGLDMGCSVGGISLGLAYRDIDCQMVGVDYDENATVLGNAVANEEDLPCDFLCMDLLGPEFASLVSRSGFDFVVWFSNWMWVCKHGGRERALELLSFVSENVPLMFFDCSQGPDDGMAGEFSLGTGAEGTRQALLDHTAYETVEDLGTTPGWRGRHMFRCS